MANILLATPISDHTVTSGYARSIFDLAKACSAKNINVDIRTIRSPEIDLARNRFATRFIKESYSHLLFIDEDMEFSPKDILACVEFDKPIVAVGYVRQGIDLKSFVEFMQKHDLKPTQENIATAMSCVSNFNLELNIDTSVKGKAEHQIQVVGGFLQVKRVGTGSCSSKKMCSCG